MGEAKRRAAKQRKAEDRPWATGKITVVANEVACFEWEGTKQEAAELQKHFLNAWGSLAHSYAARAAGYLMMYGMPKAGDVDRRPSSFGQPWQQIDVDAYRAAALWLGLREHTPAG